MAEALLLLLAAVLVVECRQLRWAVWILAVQGGLLAVAAPFPASLVTLAVQAVLLPALIYRYARHTAPAEVDGLPFGRGVAGALAAACLALAAADLYAPVIGLNSPLLPWAGALIGAGSWGVSTHRDLLKGILSFCVIQNGVHLALGGMAPHLPLSAELGLQAAVLLAVWLLLHVTHQLDWVRR